MQARIHDVFNQLIADKQVSIKTASKLAHENLRVRLCKLLSRHKFTMADIGYSDPDSVLSVCATFDGTNGTSTYSLALRRRAAATTYEIVRPNE